MALIEAMPDSFVQMPVFMIEPLERDRTTRAAHLMSTDQTTTAPMIILVLAEWKGGARGRDSLVKVSVSPIVQFLKGCQKCLFRPLCNFPASILWEVRSAWRYELDTPLKTFRAGDL